MLRKLSLSEKPDGKGTSLVSMSPKRESGPSRKFLEMFRCMEKGNWEKVHKLLKANSNKLSGVVDGSGLTPLAIALSLQCPEYIVREIIRADPESTEKVDSFGATPLHLACLNGTTPGIVQLIVNHDNGKSARTTDSSNYSVLHHAVEYICLLIESRHTSRYSSSIDSGSIQSEHEDYIKIIQIICRTAPETIHFQSNDHGDTPLDIPNIVLLRHKNPSPDVEQRILEVYRVLQRVSVKVYRQRKRQWENARSPNNKAAFCDGSLLSSTSSNTSGSALSKNISMFKDSVGDCSRDNGLGKP